MIQVKCVSINKIQSDYKITLASIKTQKKKIKQKKLKNHVRSNNLTLREFNILKKIN